MNQNKANENKISLFTAIIMNINVMEGAGIFTKKY